MANAETNAPSGPRGPRAMALTGLVGKYNSPSNFAHQVPHTIYFYYAAPTGGGSGYDVRAYIWCEDNKILPAALPGHIARLTSNARQNGSNPKPIGKSLNDVPWWRISYLVVALEDPTGFDADNAVEITRDDGSANGHPNHCFFDGGDGSITVPGEADIQAMWTVNYMKNKSGKDIPKGKVHKFIFRFNPARGRPFYPDSGGTNMGPPVPPPI